MIGGQDELREVAARLQSASEIAIDTEFVRETTYYPKLCLIQAASNDTVAGIDCLAGLDLSPLHEVLYDPERAWVLHSARQDLEVLWNATGRLPERLIDTQVAAALVGFAPQISLRALVARTVGIELDKSHARTDWTKRPIAPVHLKYALDDVRHLLGVWAHLRARLVELDRLAWFEEDTARITAAPPVTGAEALWTRLKGVSRLPGAGRRAALALIRWRELEAQRLDRPRRWILSDELVVEMARAQPSSRAELAAVPEMPRRLAARAGDAILAALGDSAADAAPAPPGRRPEPADKTLVKALQAEVGNRARELNLHSEVLATRRDLEALAAGETPADLAAGWRAAELDAALKKTLRRA